MTELGVKPGPQIGELLQYLLEQVLDQPEQMTARHFYHWQKRHILIK